MLKIEITLPKIESKIYLLIKDVTFVLCFALLTGILAKVKIEIGPVPITMQTLAVLLSGVFLGSKKGALSQITYLFIGLAGIPWFSRGGGMAYIFSPTFGYILGFVLAAFLVGWLFEKGWGENLKTSILAMIFGNLILYIPGLLWLAKFFGFNKVLAIGFYPFLIGDLLKIFLASLIFSVWWKIIKVAKKFKYYER
jgi:biotin transporter BioY